MRGRSSRHCGALVGAPPACIRAAVHFIAADLFARARTFAADLGAQCAEVGVKFRAAHHEVGARGARLGAIEQRLDVLRGRMLSAHSQASLHRLQAGAVALHTRHDAALHLARLPAFVLARP